nr:MAG TPA: hypothetical protein [Caudoviricetes sp.]DAM91059.1 MAG TPA: hypothetical protein [Caudoviricetes sp.]
MQLSAVRPIPTQALIFILTSRFWIFWNGQR